MRHLGDGSLWFDEGASVQFATMPLRDWLRFLWHGEANMLPYYLLLRGWLFLGHSEFMVRLPSALFGAATAPVVYILLRRLSGVFAGLMAVGLLALHDFHVSYSQEARSYSMVVFMLCLSWLALAHLVENDSRRMRWMYLITAGLATYGHFFAGLVLISQWISVYCFAPGEAVYRLRKLSLMTAAMIAPAVLYGFAHRGGINWVPPATSARLLHSALVISGNRWLLVAAFALVVAFASWHAAKIVVANGRSISAWNAAAPVTWLLFMPVLLLAVSIVKPMLVTRYLLLVLPALVMVVATGLTELKPIAASALAVLLSLVLLQATLASKSFEQPHQDWRSAGRYLAAHAVAGDGALFLPDIGRAPFNWYWLQQRPMPQIVFPGRGPGFTLPAAHQRPETALEAAKAAPPPRTWFLLTTPDLDPKVPLFRNELALIYSHSCEHQLREVLIVLYAKDAVDCPAK
ncbi:MAG TPA: glycosyltransferase family 39 protein [Terriglobales bacterium]|nr:glycosyltransferase family 39 protein [Terriglobales bacterium]